MFPVMLKACSDTLSTLCAEDSTKGNRSSPWLPKLNQPCQATGLCSISVGARHGDSCKLLLMSNRLIKSSMLHPLGWSPGELLRHPEGEAFTFGSSRCKPRSLLAPLCLKTLNHIELPLLIVAQLHTIQL